jgi:hypothetical protein
MFPSRPSRPRSRGGSTRRGRHRRLAVCGLVVAALAAAAAPSAHALQAPCTFDHCYALADWTMPTGMVGGINVDVWTGAATLPTTDDRVQNEAWAQFDDGGWVEAGDTAGAIGSAQGPSPAHLSPLVYFSALSRYYGGYGGWFEQDSSVGPALNQTFNIDQHYVPSFHGWYESVGGTLLAAWGGTPPSAFHLSAGEELTDPRTLNWGAAYNLKWWSAHLGVLYSGWQWSGYNAQQRVVPAAPSNVTCADLHGGTTYLWFQANTGPC